MSHQHHNHSHTPNTEYLNKAFIIGITLNLVFVAVEFGAGLWLNSLALISDAGHNLSDVISLVLAMLAFKLVKIKPTKRFTYGFKKSSILVSLLNAFILLIAVGFIVAESIKKIQNPQPIEGGVVAWVAGIGIIINGFTAWLFMKDRHKDLNIKGAYLHMLADTLVSVGVLIAGIIIQYTGWFIIDPIISIVIAVVILLSTTSLLTDSLRLSLDGVPPGIVTDDIKNMIVNSEPDIVNIHHLHVWALSTTENALTAHITVKPETNITPLKNRIKHLLEHENITHATLEFEYPGEECKESCNEKNC